MIFQKNYLFITCRHVFTCPKRIGFLFFSLCDQSHFIHWVESVCLHILCLLGLGEQFDLYHKQIYNKKRLVAWRSTRKKERKKRLYPYSLKYICSMNWNWPRVPMGKIQNPLWSATIPKNRHIHARIKFINKQTKYFFFRYSLECEWEICHSDMMIMTMLFSNVCPSAENLTQNRKLILSKRKI